MNLDRYAQSGIEVVFQEYRHPVYAQAKVVSFIFFLCATLGISAITLRNARPIDGILTVVQAFLITVIVSILEYSGRNQAK